MLIIFVHYLKLNDQHLKRLERKIHSNIMYVINKNKQQLFHHHDLQKQKKTRKICSIFGKILISSHYFAKF